MSKVHAVLLVPAEGDPHGLLKEGPCGARPPMAVRWHPDVLHTMPLDGEWHEGGAPGKADRITALVLAWNGKPVAEGVWRISGYTVTGLVDYSYVRTDRNLADILAGANPGRAMVYLRKALAALGTLVLLDAKRCEVTHG